MDEETEWAKERRLRTALVEFIWYCNPARWPMAILVWIEGFIPRYRCLLGAFVFFFIAIPTALALWTSFLPSSFLQRMVIVLAMTYWQTLLSVELITSGMFIAVVWASLLDRRRIAAQGSDTRQPTLTGMEKEGHHVLLKHSSQTINGQSGTMLRISMLNTTVKQLLGCRAIIDGVKCDGESYYDEQLVLVAYNKPRLVDQTFQLSGLEEGFLDVFFVRLNVRPLFFLPLVRPASLSTAGLNPGTYVLKIVLSGHDFSPVTETFEFKWDGDINSAALLKL